VTNLDLAFLQINIPISMRCLIKTALPNFPVLWAENMAYVPCISKVG